MITNLLAESSQQERIAESAAFAEPTEWHRWRQFDDGARAPSQPIGRQFEQHPPRRIDPHLDRRTDSRHKALQVMLGRNDEPFDDFVDEHREGLSRRFIARQIA